jgi:hypothetical protein
MNKRLNTLFFGTCFMAALLAESYCFIVLNGDLISTAGIGIVVLITGYLLMDSIRSNLKNSTNNARFYMDHIMKEETERWNDRFTEIVNLQKATYSAMKKNTALLSEQFSEVLLKLDSLETIDKNELQKITELLKKSLEGQKNALNLEINYNRENTKQIIHAIKQKDSNYNVNEQLSSITELLEKTNELLENQPIQAGKHSYDNPSVREEDFTGYEDNVEKEETGILPEYSYNETNQVSDLTFHTSEQENASEFYQPQMEEIEPEAEITDTEKESISKPLVKPLYDDPNKNLSADEIAALFASVGN